MPQVAKKDPPLGAEASRPCQPMDAARIFEDSEVTIMERTEFLSRLEDAIHKYDLLCHPFYKAWSAGELTRNDLREYAQDYYHHVEAFPEYLAEFGVRLDEGDLRRAVLANMIDEKGGENSSGESETSHAELWLDFVEGMGGLRAPHRQPIAAVRELTSHFHKVAGEG